MRPGEAESGHCKRYADGLTSIVDLGAGHGSIYAVELSKTSWLQMELGLPGSEIGGLFRIGGHHHGIKDWSPTSSPSREAWMSRTATST